MLDRLIFASVQGLIALGGVGLICLVFRKLPATFKVWLWRLAMLKMAFALCFPAPTLHILPADNSVATHVKLAPVAQADVPLSAADLAFLSQLPVVEASTPAPEAPKSTPTPVDYWTLTWLAGSLVMGGIALFALFAARKAAKRTSPVCDVEAHESAREAATVVGLRRPPALRAFAHTGSPFVTGLLRPLVAVPEALLANLRELRLTLLHEFAHLRRGDLRWSFVMSLLRSAFWFHPLAWIAEREHRVQSEIACDAFVVRSGGDRRDYALALVRMAVLGGPHRGSAILGAVGSRRALLRRLNEMSNPSSRNMKLRAALAIALPAAVLMIPLHLAAKSPQHSPESDPSVPMVVPAISPDNLDDITLPALEKMPAPTAEELKAKIAVLKNADLSKPEDVDNQLIALKTIGQTQMKNLTPQQKADVEKALQQAIKELQRALHEELPKAMAEAEKAAKEGHSTGIDAKAIREQIERSVTAALMAAQEALRKVHSGGGPEGMTLDLRNLKMDEGARKEMKKAFDEMKVMDLSKMKMDPEASKEMQKALEKMKTLDFSKMKIDEESQKEMKKAFEEMKAIPFDMSNLKMDGEWAKELEKNGVKWADPKALAELMKARGQGLEVRQEALKELEAQGLPLRIMGELKAGGLGGDHRTITLSGDGEIQIIVDGKKMKIVGDKIVDENGKEVPNVKVIRSGHAPSDTAPRLAIPGQAPRAWTYTVPPRGAAPAAPGTPQVWINGAPVTPRSPGAAPHTVYVAPGSRYMIAPATPGTTAPTMSFLTAPDYRAIEQFYANPKKLTKEQKDRLKKIDAEIQKLMRERARLAPGGGYYVVPGTPRAPRANGRGGNTTPAPDVRVTDSYPGLFPPTIAPPAPAKGGDTPPPSGD